MSFIKNMVINQQNKIQEHIELGERFGLAFTGEVDENNMPIFIGRDYQFKKYELCQ